MDKPLISSHRLTIGAQHRDKIMGRLLELKIPCEESRGLSASVIIIRLYDEKHSAAYLTFRRELLIFPKQLQDIEIDQEVSKV